jgi:hypothetical protein
MFYDFPLQFPEGFQHMGHGTGIAISCNNRTPSDSLTLLSEQIAGFSPL